MQDCIMAHLRSTKNTNAHWGGFGSRVLFRPSPLCTVYCLFLSLSLSTLTHSLLFQVYLKFKSSFGILIVTYVWRIAIISTWEVTAQVFLHGRLHWYQSIGFLFFLKKRAVQFMKDKPIFRSSIVLER